MKWLLSIILFLSIGCKDDDITIIPVQPMPFHQSIDTTVAQELILSLENEKLYILMSLIKLTRRMDSIRIVDNYNLSDAACEVRGYSYYNNEREIMAHAEFMDCEFNNSSHPYQLTYATDWGKKGNQLQAIPVYMAFSYRWTIYSTTIRSGVDTIGFVDVWH